MQNNNLWRALCDTFEAIQKERIRASNRLQAVFRGVDEREELRIRVLSRLEELEKVEEGLEKDLKQILKEHPVYMSFLRHVKGVGPLLSIRLLALPLDPQRNISSWWAYFGLAPFHYVAKCENGHNLVFPKEKGTCPVCQAPIASIEKVNGAPRRKKGHKSFWNTQARKIAYLLGEQFVKISERGYYGRAYRRFKSRQPLDLPAIQRDARARRLAVKLFLSHLHECMRELSGLEPIKPYAFEFLKHVDYISWKEVVNLELSYKSRETV
ncbi:hypothetical protein [Hydrogenobacter thermophilus]|uniref:hypothetical protein n=1 Tax=Hydrogenobacter thermophilus TaxID=940 RepID=UPI0030F504F9